MSEDDLGATEAEAALETRRELGARYDAALVEGFADRIERAAAARGAEHAAQVERVAGHQVVAGGRQLAIGVVSVVAMIPIAIVLGLNGALLALLLTLGSVVAVNVSHAWLSRPR